MVIAGAVAESPAGLAERREVELTLTGRQSVEARVDRSSVERAVSNLVTNAIEHAPARSAVTIEVDRVGDEAEIVVTDSGPGIPAEHQADIFDRYWQVGAPLENPDRNAEPNPDRLVGTPSNGAGIGLAIVRQVAVAHGGDVFVTSPVDGKAGARFRMTVRTG